VDIRKSPAAWMAAGVVQKALALPAVIFNVYTSFPRQRRQAVDSGDWHPETNPMEIRYAMFLRLMKVHRSFIIILSLMLFIGEFIVLTVLSVHKVWKVGI
jgi:hypothetical protein